MPTRKPRKPANILVTGADGFIGSHLVEHLVRCGHSVRAFVYYNSFDSWGWLDHAEPSLKNSFEVFPGDIRDPHAVRQATIGCDVVMHLASLVGIPYSYSAPDNYVDTNIKGTLNILQAARDIGIRRLIHTSTSEVYGTAQFVPITEKHPLHPQSPYAATKVAADQLALSFHDSFDTPVVILRPFNTFGPRQSARAIIPTIITQIALGARNLKLGALHPTRDFCFVEDTIRAFSAAMDAPNVVGQTINVATGREISIGDLALLIAELMNVKVDITSEQRRLRPTASEVERLCGDYRLAQRLLAWKPRFGGKHGLRLGLKQTIAWFQNKENLAHYRPGSYSV